MSIFSMKNISYDFGDNNLLKGIDLSIEKHHRFGLIGKNGCGKTTLFKLISGELDALSGEISKMSNINIAYLSQELKVSSELSLIDYVLSTQSQYLNLKKSIEEAEQNVSNDHSQANLDRLHQLQISFDAIHGFEYAGQPHSGSLLLLRKEISWAGMNQKTIGSSFTTTFRPASSR